jgi:hypothetical protein
MKSNVEWQFWGMHGISHELGCLVTTLRSLGFCDLGLTFLVEDGIQPCVYGRKADLGTV